MCEAVQEPEQFSGGPLRVTRPEVFWKCRQLPCHRVEPCGEPSFEIGCVADVRSGQQSVREHPTTDSLRIEREQQRLRGARVGIQQRRLWRAFSDASAVWNEV